MRSSVHCGGSRLSFFTDSVLHGHMGCILSRVAGCKEWSRAAAGSPWVTARAACSGSRLGSVRMAVVVLRRRSELRTTERNDKHRLQWETCGMMTIKLCMGAVRIRI